MQAVFQFPRCTLRRLAGLTGKIIISGPDGLPALVSRQPATGLRRGMHIWQAGASAQPLLTIRPRASAAGRVYEVVSADKAQPLGAVSSPALSASLRDAWRILDAAGRPLAELTASALGSLAEVGLSPQSYHFQAGGRPVGRLRVNRSRIQPEIELELTGSPSPLDPRLALAAAIILLSEMRGVE